MKNQIEMIKPTYEELERKVNFYKSMYNFHATINYILSAICGGMGYFIISRIIQ